MVQQIQGHGGASHSPAAKKLAELIEGIDIAMLTSIDLDGTLRSRPMATQKTEFDGEQLWFFTDIRAHKVNEIEREHQVNLAYAKPDEQKYVSVSGLAEVLRDESKARELWSPALRAWFPNGPDDPDMALLRIQVEKAEYWDAPSSTFVKLVGFAKAVATGQRYQPGEHGQVGG